MSIRDMVTRNSDYNETRDFIPTPPFVTRALYEHVSPVLRSTARATSIWDPAAGEAHMTRVFEEYGHPEVRATDILANVEKGVGEYDFVGPPLLSDVDYIVTNPPYKLLNNFVSMSLQRAKKGVAMLTRVQALEGQRRYASIYRDNPPTTVAFFSDRIPFKSGKVVREASKMYFHVWLWWDLEREDRDPPIWVRPDVQKQLEKDEDYE